MHQGVVTGAARAGEENSKQMQKKIRTTLIPNVLRKSGHGADNWEFLLWISFYFSQNIFIVLKLSALQWDKAGFILIVNHSQHSFLIYLPGNGPPGEWLEDGFCLRDSNTVTTGDLPARLDWSIMGWTILLLALINLQQKEGSKRLRRGRLPAVPEPAPQRGARNWAARSFRHSQPRNPWWPPRVQAWGFRADLCLPAFTTVGHFHFIFSWGN